MAKISITSFMEMHTQLGSSDILLLPTEDESKADAGSGSSFPPIASMLECLWETSTGPCLDAVGYQNPTIVDDWQASPLTMGDSLDLPLQEILPFLAYLSACSTKANQSEKLDCGSQTVEAGCVSMDTIAVYQLAGFRHVVEDSIALSDWYRVETARTRYKTLRDEEPWLGARLVPWRQ